MPPPPDPASVAVSLEPASTTAPFDSLQQILLDVGIPTVDTVQQQASVSDSQISMQSLANMPLDANCSFISLLVGNKSNLAAESL